MTDSSLITLFIDIAILIFLLGLGGLILWVLVLYLIDVRQTQHTIRRNYPVIGRFRYWFEHLGEFFRQYFFAMDREELPFNRAQRSYVYRAAKNVDRNMAFGSTHDIQRPGSILFMNSAFPTLSTDSVGGDGITVGPHCLHPYTTRSFFNISGMSFGALSAPAVRALSRGAKQAGCWLNTGEGGLSPHHLEGGADIVFQIGTAKYGVRDLDGHLDDSKLKQVAAHQQVKMFEIKLSQGAKPGKGGILPADKISAEVAATRGIPTGQDSISPNGHPEVRSVSDLLDMIHRVRTITGKPTGIKFVLGEQRWLDGLFHEIQRRGIESAPDFITLDGAEGGTGAAPQPLLDFVGLSINESLPWLIDQLLSHGLRDRIRVIASGKLLTPSRLAWALAMGADFVCNARGFMFSLGCIQAMQCHKNTCPTGITTHDKKLQKGLDITNKSHRVMHYHHNMTYDVGMIAHSCGVSDPRELTRNHVRKVTAEGVSIPMSASHPEPIRFCDD